MSDEADLLQFGGAFQIRDFIVFFIDSQDGGKVDYAEIANLLPTFDKNQNEGPVFGLIVPVNGAHAEKGKDAFVEKAVGGAQKRKGQEAHHHHGDQEGDLHQKGKEWSC